MGRSGGDSGGYSHWIRADDGSARWNQGLSGNNALSQVNIVHE